jgi:hypothetical protein
VYRWANVSKQNKAGIVVIGMAAKSPDAAMSASMDSLEPDESGAHGRHAGGWTYSTLRTWPGGIEAKRMSFGFAGRGHGSNGHWQPNCIVHPW